MHDVIYVPLGDTEALKKRRQKVILEFVEQGWTHHGLVEIRDNFGTLVTVQVLMRPIEGGGR